MAESMTKQLAVLIEQLQAQRQEHLEAIATIDESFAQFGLDTGPAPGGKRRPGRPKGSKSKKKKKVVVARGWQANAQEVQG